MGKDFQAPQAKRVKIGSTVSVLFDTGAVLSITIKTPREVNPASGIVSYASPLGSAILDKGEGGEFQYTVGDRRFSGKVIKIQDCE